MKAKLLFVISIAFILVLAPSGGLYYDSSVMLPKLSISDKFGRGIESGSSQIGIVWNGGKGITETVADIMKRERDNPFQWNGNVREPKEENEEEFVHPEKQINPDAPEIPCWPYDLNQKQRQEPGRDLPQTIGTSFQGTVVSESGFIPPDNNGAVGPTQVFVPSNGRIKVFSKSGVLGSLNTTSNNFFASVMTPGSGTSDPHVRYDRLTQRWFITMIDVATPNRVLIAVSSGPTIVSSSSFTFFWFQHDLVGPTPNSDTGGFADYDTLGLDKFALYVGVNVFNASGTSFLGTTGFVINKANLISGTLTVTAFRQLCTASGAGPYTPQGVDNDDPSSTEGYFIGVDNAVFSQLDVKRITNPGGTPSISGNMTITVPTTAFPQNQPANGSIKPLDALDDRLFAAQLKKNTLTGVTSLWTAHNIKVNSSGVGTSTGDRNGSRWYELRNMTTTPTLFQSGTLFDNAASNPRGFWIPGCAMSGQGHMALCTSTAGNNFFAEISSSGRLSGDAAGTIQSFTLAQSSTFTYNVQNGVQKQRWGDYAQITVDPLDNMTMWAFQEYCNANNSWCVRAIQLNAPPPATPTTATNVTQGLASVNTTITGTVVSGSGFYDPGSDAGGPGFSGHISVSVSGGVTVNSVTFNSPTQLTVNLNTTAATIGTKNVTVTNPDGQLLTGANILSVDAPLPVTMQSFNAGVFDGNNIELNWVTSSEINNSGFSVERSPKDINNWKAIGFVTGHGTTNQPESYSYADTKLGSGKYDYRLKQIDYNGNFAYFYLGNFMSVGIPGNFDVSQSYPNPSNPKSKIDYQLPFTGKILIKVYDLTGREVTTLVNDVKDAGYYSIDFDGTNLASGIYVYRTEAKDVSSSLSFSKTMKMVLVK